MVCKNCGQDVSENLKFCTKCGVRLDGTSNKNNKVLKFLTNKKFIFSIIAFSVTILTIFILLNAFDKENQFINIGEKETEIKANLSNWAFACEVYDQVYYSDHKTGIYIDGQIDEIFISGRYSDLSYNNGKLFCIEFYTIQHNENSSTEANRLVMIDIFTKEKEIVYSPSSTNTGVSISNIIDDKIYFVSGNDVLYYTDISGKVVDTGFRNVILASQNGIYTTKSSSFGLQLISYEKELIKEYDELDSYECYICFEMREYIYLKLYNSDATEFKFIRMNINTGFYEEIANQNISGEIKNINYYNNELIIISSDDRNIYIYETSLSGNNPKQIKEILKTDKYTYVYTISIVKNNKAYLVFPYSETHWETITIK